MTSTSFEVSNPSENKSFYILPDSTTLQVRPPHKMGMEISSTTQEVSSLNQFTSNIHYHLISNLDSSQHQNAISGIPIPKISKCLEILGHSKLFFDQPSQCIYRVCHHFVCYLPISGVVTRCFPWNLCPYTLWAGVSQAIDDMVQELFPMED